MFLVWSMLHARIEGLFIKFNRPFTHLVRTKQTISSQHFWRLHPNLHSQYINICKMSNFANDIYLQYLQYDAHSHLTKSKPTSGERNPPHHRTILFPHLQDTTASTSDCNYQKNLTRIETYRSIEKHFKLSS